MHMQSPELLLKDLNRALLELNAASVVLNDQELASELREVTRRLVLAEVLADTTIIAIGGSQGAGKTTLMMSMYGLEGGGGDWLNPNEGRGERLPVLILEEDSCVSPRGALRELGPLDEAKQRIGVVERWVEVGEFQSAICDAKTNVMLPVLYVPRTYLTQPGQAFLLLPGYEQEDRDNAAWQQLMRQALVGATGCILVTDETRLAGQRETEILRDMLANELPGAQPLVVISKTEGLAAQPERLSELRKRAGEVFQIPAGEIDRRVHCIGSSDPAYKDQWLPKLRQALNDMAMGSVCSRQAQLSRLHDVLEKRLGRVLNLAGNRSRLHFGRGAGEDGGALEVVTRVLEAFDEAKSDLEEKFKAAMTSMVASQSKEAWESLESKLIEEYEGFTPKVKGLLDTTSEKHQRLVRDTESAWPNPDKVLESFVTETANLTHEKLRAPKDLSALKDASVFKRLGYVGSDGAITAWGRPTKDDIRNMQVLLGSPSVQADLPALATKELESTVRILPALALEWARLASLMPALVGVDSKSLTSLPVTDVNAAVQSIKEQFEQATDISTSILRGVAIVMAVDVGVDGQIDSLPALITALAGGTQAASATAATGAAATTATAAAGVSVAGAVVGIIAVAYLAHSALQEVRRHDVQVRSVAQQMLSSISDHHLVHFMSRFNQLMSELRQHLQQRLQRRYRLDEQLMTQDRLAKALADVAGGQRELLEQLALSGRSLSVMPGSWD
jgi:energy-coupling factor transporter ATP-binding protein EcfA2